MTGDRPSFVIPTPAALSDAAVELEAKKAAGYYTPDGGHDAKGLAGVKGRDLERF